MSLKTKNRINSNRLDRCDQIKIEIQDPYKTKCLDHQILRLEEVLREGVWQAVIEERNDWQEFSYQTASGLVKGYELPGICLNDPFDRIDASLSLKRDKDRLYCAIGTDSLILPRPGSFFVRAEYSQPGTGAMANANFSTNKENRSTLFPNLDFARSLLEVDQGAEMFPLEIHLSDIRNHPDLSFQFDLNGLSKIKSHIAFGQFDFNNMDY